MINSDIFTQEYYKKYPNSKFKILEIANYYNVFIQTEYGICRMRKQHLMNGVHPTIQSAVNKNEYFANVANKVHNYKYDYSIVKYNNAIKKVEIICKEHGKFLQIPRDHWKGKGCSKCGDKRCSEHHKDDPSGWRLEQWKYNSAISKDFESFKVYIVECWNDVERFFKIGRTFRPIKTRLRGASNLPYNYKIIKIITGEADEIFEKEFSLKLLNYKNRYNPKIIFPGNGECFFKIDLD